MQPNQTAEFQRGSEADERPVQVEPTHPNAVLIHADLCYVAYATDLEYMWHWEISRDGEFVQEGCSLSESSSREAVSHVIKHYHLQEKAKAMPGGNAEAIRELLLEVGIAQPFSRDEEAAQVEPH